MGDRSNALPTDVVSRRIKTIATGEVAGSATAVVLPTISCDMIIIRAQSTNAGNVYLGTSSSATVAAGNTDATTGLELDAGQDTGWLPLSNLNQLFIICNNAGDDITYMAVTFV